MGVLGLYAFVGLILNLSSQSYIELDTFNPPMLDNRPQQMLLLIGGVLFVGIWASLANVRRSGLLPGLFQITIVASWVILLGFILTSASLAFDPNDSTLQGLQLGTSIVLIGTVLLFFFLLSSRGGRGRLSTENIRDTSARFSDYLRLTKPVIVVLLLVTTLAAMILAAGEIPPLSLIFWTMVGGALTAGGSSALNQYIDRDTDRKMSRTQRRPIVEGRIRDSDAIAFGLALCIAGFYILAVFVNLLAAFLALVGILYYVVFYSLVLKHSTPQNIVVGGGAGAIPPLVGWAAVTASLSVPAFFLFAIIFFWTPPHFWALALLKERDYKRAGVPMLPVIHGEDATRGQIFLYSIQLVALTLLLPLAKLGSWLFLISAIALGAGMVMYAWRLMRSGGNTTAWKMYRYSSMYLALIFFALVVDTLVVG